MDDSAYRFNSEVSYEAGGVYPTLATAEDLTKIQIVVKTDGSAFPASFPDSIFRSYVGQPVNSDKVVEAWKSNPMQFWQNQVNYAVWCATTGCGVSWGDHLEVTDPLARSLFRFHACFQVRRILAELQTPLTQDRAHDPHDNPFDRRAYERLCDEFGVSPQTHWRQKATVDNDGAPSTPMTVMATETSIRYTASTSDTIPSAGPLSRKRPQSRGLHMQGTFKPQ